MKIPTADERMTYALPKVRRITGGTISEAVQRSVGYRSRQPVRHHSPLCRREKENGRLRLTGPA